MVDIDDIRRARERLGDAIYTSPCVRSETLSRMTGADLYLKLENLQLTGSFKERGALNKVLTLSADERARGVIAASAGNHAQGLAHAAATAGVPATIVIPVNAPLTKVSATRGFGAEVVLEGEDYDGAYDVAQRIAQERGLAFVHAFDDDDVIAGQGTLGLEIAEQVDGLDAVVVPVGGGGLAAGVGTALAAMAPDVQLYGVEAARVPALRVALDAGTPTTVPAARTLADGIAVRRVGQRTFDLLRRHVVDLVMVDEEEIAEAILVLLELEKTLAEGAGAAPLAAMLGGHLPLAGKRVVLVVSGGNIDVTRLARIIDLGLVKSGRSMRICVLVPDVPGTLASLLGAIATAGANVTSVHHDRRSARAGVGRTEVDLVLETRGFEHVQEVQQAIREAGWEIAS